jgi:signal transduction histidine kinase
VLGLQVDGALPPLLSDRRIVHLVLIDLLGFVVQNSGQGQIEVRVSDEDGRLKLSVRDNAARISDEQLADFFSPLDSIADLRWRSGHGSGLGLYVVRDLARAISGDLEIDTQVSGDGNLFVLSLPALGPQLVKRPAARVESSPGPRRAAATVRSEAPNEP